LGHSADAAFLAGHEVKKAEIHGMSQRGGSVSSDVRFGGQPLSPMIPDGEADALLALADDQVDLSLGRLRSGGTLIRPGAIDLQDLANRKSFNVAMLGVLSAHLDIPLESWQEAVRANLPEKVWADNEEAFALGRKAARAGRQSA